MDGYLPVLHTFSVPYLMTTESKLKGRQKMNIKISKTEIAKRKRQLKKSGGHPIPDSQTPWQEIQREIVDELSEGMVLKPATKYQKIDRKKGIPRDNH